MATKTRAPLLSRCTMAAVMFGTACSDSTGPVQVQGRAVYAIDESNQMRKVGTENPDETSRQVTITGTASGETIVGIDFNAVDGNLYGVGSSANIYVIDTLSGQATLVGVGGFGSLSGNTFFGMDFNPVPDRLRVHGDGSLNLRLNQLTGVLAATDTALVYAAGDVNAGATANVVGTAYTNSLAGATATTLFAIDSDLDVLVTLPSPNSGKLTTVGALGVNTSDRVGLDITGDDGTAYAALTTAGSGSALYTIDLVSGQATLIGSIAGGAVVGIAVAP